MRKITEHFSAEEFACKDGTPYPAELYDLLLDLCSLLEDIRELVGNRPITIISGYRTPEYNRKIGGARKSQHVEGRAADIAVKGMSARVMHDRILSGVTYSAKVYDGPNNFLFLGGLGAYPNFTHVDTRFTYRLIRWKGTRKVS